MLYVQQIMVSYLHSQPVDSICFSPDGTLLASAASDDCVRLWNVAERKPVSMLEGRTGAATPSQVSFFSRWAFPGNGWGSRSSVDLGTEQSTDRGIICCPS